jgi:hypothetical protein
LREHRRRVDAVGRDVTHFISPLVFKRWFTAAGSPATHDAMMIQGAVKTGLYRFINLMRFWHTHWIVLQIDKSFC